uniref:Uncharacterized protein n=1 Tax=Anguilla anguilla TaxID=7936 RepID=A0A0E9QB69_ANGAN
MPVNCLLNSVLAGNYSLLSARACFLT